MPAVVRAAHFLHRYGRYDHPRSEEGALWQGIIFHCTNTNMSIGTPDDTDLGDKGLSFCCRARDLNLIPLQGVVSEKGK